MAMMLVDGVALPTPSTFEWGMIDVSAGDSGRTQDAQMHKNRIAQKRQLKLSWSGTDTARTARILQMVNPEYIRVTYPDAMSGTDETRTFYVGDRSAPIKIWTINNKRSRQDMTAEYQTCGQMETSLPRINAMLNYNHVDKIGNDVAKTLCARDYKGFGTGFDTMNGVIEWKN